MLADVRSPPFRRLTNIPLCGQRTVCVPTSLSVEHYRVYILSGILQEEGTSQQPLHSQTIHLEEEENSNSGSHVSKFFFLVATCSVVHRNDSSVVSGANQDKEMVTTQGHGEGPSTWRWGGVPGPRGDPSAWSELPVWIGKAA